MELAILSSASQVNNDAVVPLEQINPIMSLAESGWGWIGIQAWNTIVWIGPKS
jgi:hypothetical protein